jgi:hypothetical protein
MTVLTEAVHAGAFIVSEANGRQSREEVFIEASETVYAGSVLGKTVNQGSAPNTPRAAATASAGNTGNATIAVDATEPVQPAAQDGTYTVLGLVGGTTTAEWEVFDPHGISLGRVETGATFNNQIKFVITAGGTASAVGDGFAIAVGVEAETAVASEQLGMVGQGSITMDATAPVNFATAQPGLYSAVCTATASGGTFTVYDPDGNSLGTVAAGATFNTQIKFVIAASGTDFALGDTFLIEVALGEIDRFLYAPLDLSGTDGTQNAAGVAVYPITTTSAGPGATAAIVRNAEVRLADLTWPSGITATQQAIAIEQLHGLGIICR